MSETDGREIFIPRCYEGEGPVEGEKQMLWYECISMHTVCQPSKIELRGGIENQVLLASTAKICWQDHISFHISF